MIPTHRQTTFGNGIATVFIHTGATTNSQAAEMMTHIEENRLVIWIILDSPDACDHVLSNSMVTEAGSQSMTRVESLDTLWNLNIAMENQHV